MCHGWWIEPTFVWLAAFSGAARLTFAQRGRRWGGLKTLWLEGWIFTKKKKFQSKEVQIIPNLKIWIWYNLNLIMLEIYWIFLPPPKIWWKCSVVVSVSSYTGIREMSILTSKVFVPFNRAESVPLRVLVWIPDRNETSLEKPFPLSILRTPL